MIRCLKPDTSFMDDLGLGYMQKIPLDMLSATWYGCRDSDRLTDDDDDDDDDDDNNNTTDYDVVIVRLMVHATVTTMLLWSCRLLSDGADYL